MKNKYNFTYKDNFKNCYNDIFNVEIKSDEKISKNTAVKTIDILRNHTTYLWDYAYLNGKRDILWGAPKIYNVDDFKIQYIEIKNPCYSDRENKEVLTGGVLYVELKKQV